MNTQLDKKTAPPSQESKLAVLLKGMEKLLRRNMGWKITALLLAIVMWAGLISQDSSLTREKIFVDVPVSITGAESLQRNGYIVTSDLTENPISVRMKADVPQLEYNMVTATTYNPRIELSRIRTAGKQTVKIATTSTSTFGTVTELIPSEVEIEVEEYITRYRIPVSVVQSGEVPEGFYLDDLSIDPSLVAVSGPKTLVNQVRRAVVNLDLNALPAQEGSSALALPLVLQDAKGNAITSGQVQVTSESVLLDSVVVSYDLYPTQMITLSGIGMTKGEPAAGYEVKKVTVTPNTIQAAASAEDLQILNLDALFLDQAVSLEGRTESFTEAVRVRKPSGVINLTPDSVTVAVEIGPVIGEKTFKNLKVDLINVPEGLKAQAENQRASLILSGPVLWMEKVRSSNLSLWADLSDLQAGSHEVQIQCAIEEAEGVSYVFKVEPGALEVNLTAK
ncbi:MAG: hypothetical protein IJ461_00380 [Clostridia bacterium]|nr:hypothetical protein [Clostridia bacterium]